MSTTVVCPQCAAKLKAPEQLQGKTVKCPRCQTGVAIPLAPAEDDFEVLEEAETTANGAATVAENVPEVATVQPVEPAKPAEGPQRKKRRRKKRKGFFDRLPAIGVDERIIMGGMALVGLLVFGGCFFTGMYFAFRTPPPDDIPEEQWKPLEIANRCKVLLPATSKSQSQSMFGMTVVMHQCQPDKDSAFGIGYTEGVLPPERRKLSADELLEDSCNGAIANLEKMGGKESKREPISLGEYPGRQMIIKVPQASGKFIMRNYLVGGRLYILMCGGRGYDVGQNNVKKFFDSFEILETGAPAPPPGGKPSEAPASGGTKPASPEPVGVIDLPPGEQVLGLGLNPTGDTLTVGTRDGQALWYNTESRKLAAGPNGTPLPAERGGMSACAVSPDGLDVVFTKTGGLLTLVSRNDPPEVMLERDRGGTVPHAGLAFAPGGQYFCQTFGSRTAHVWDVRARQRISELKGFQSELGAASYSPDGSLLACADTDIHLRGAQDPSPRGKLPGPGGATFTRLAFSGRTLAGVCDRTVYLWTLEDGPKVQAGPRSELPHTSPITAIAFSPSGRLVTATADGRLTVFDGRPLRKLAEMSPKSESGLTALAIRSTGELYAGAGGHIFVYDLKNLTP